MLSPASSVVSLSTELSDPGPHPCAGLDDGEDEAGERVYAKWEEQQNPGTAYMPRTSADDGEADSRMSLRTALRPPARLRGDEELTLDVMRNQASRIAASRTSLVNHTLLPPLEINVAPRRGRPKKRSATPASYPSSQVSSRQHSPAAFPSLEPGTLPPTREEKRHAAIKAWAEEDDRMGRWGETWDEVGPYADEREVKRAVEGRAKRACYWEKKTASQWYYQEMLEQSKRPQGQMHLTRRANVIHVLKTGWRAIAKDVFGEESVMLEGTMMEIYMRFWQ
ncbi:Hypothetical protein D9617_11g009330 [Elsinoe fawcettii]|nr:Hypothetical protein D9617_11g009330 [Elsinoe fawcettii]